ncbi:MAG: GIY-YIG nuclease family protein [Microscillaceae bacterium]|jgi:prophage antirepressor-like protein|nr:GIY-YIG nuclease family protein [Microscillaceae bacterium]
MKHTDGLSTFFFDEINQVRIIIIADKVWFCGIDICNILGYKNNSKAINDHCRPKGITKRYLLSNGGKQEYTFISEGNLYRLITKSQKPEAEKFESWIFDEVLPQLRKTGSYSLQQSPENVPLEIVDLVKQLFAELSAQMLDKQQENFEKIEDRLQKLEKRTATLPDNLEAFVYVMHNPDSNGYKIGRSKDIVARMTTGRTFAPGLQVVLAIPCPSVQYSNALENLLKAHFYYQRIDMEWYRLESDDLIQIYELVKALGLG